jgi:hypothetical protein
LARVSKEFVQLHPTELKSCKKRPSGSKKSERIEGGFEAPRPEAVHPIKEAICHAVEKVP